MRIWDMWAQHLEKIESGALPWPNVLATFAVGMIPKTEDRRCLKLRGIGVMSVFYAAWSSMRFDDHKLWAASTLPPQIYGGLPDRSTTDAEIPAHLELEIAKLDKLICQTLDIDREKHFDNVAWILVRLVAAIGGHPGTVRALNDLYRQSRRYYKINNVFSKPVRPTNALIQGCALAVLISIVSFSILVLEINIQCPTISSALFIDDCRGRTSTQSQEEGGKALQKAASLHVEFDSYTGNIQNRPKSNVTSTGKRKNRQDLSKQIGGGILPASKLKSLGYSWSTFARPERSLANDRADYTHQ